MPMPSHSDIRDFLEALGYEETQKGHCHGIGNIILQSFFVENGLGACLKRLRKMSAIITSSRPIPFSREDFLRNIKNMVDDLPPEEKYDLYAFSDSIKILQSPQKYTQYFPKNKKKITQHDLLDTLNLILSKKLEIENKTLNVHPNLSGIYNIPELTDLLKSLREELDASTSLSPTVVDISNSSSYSKSAHMTGFAYDPIKKLWYFVNSNTLPPEEIKAGKEKTLANAIFNAYNIRKWQAPSGRGKENDIDSMAISFSLRNVSSSAEETANQKQAIEEWKRSQTYQILHEYTPERINKTDKYGKFWLDMAEGEVEKNILSKRSFKSYLKAYLKNLSIPSLIIDVLFGSLLGVSLYSGYSIITGSAAIAAIKSLEAMTVFLLSAAISSPIGIGLMIGIPLSLITLKFFIPFICQKIAGCLGQPTIQSQNVNEITFQAIHPEENSAQQIFTLLNDNGECVFKEINSTTDQSLLNKKEGIPPENSTENNLPLNMEFEVKIMQPKMKIN